MMTKNEEGKKKDMSVVRVPNFVKVYATNVTGGITNQDFRFELLNEKIYDGKEWVLLSDALVILSPLGAKKLFNLLKQMIETYEKEKGEINVDLDEKVYKVE